MLNNVGPWEGFVYTSRSLLELLPEKAACGAVLAWVSGALGADPILVLLTLAALVADFLLGFGEALRRGHFRCRALARGAAKLPCYCVYIILVWWVDVALSRAAGLQLPLVKFFLAYLILTDTLSILGHLQRLGWRVPRILRTVAANSRLKVERAAEQATRPERGEGR